MAAARDGALVGADGAQALVDLGEAARARRCSGLGEQAEAFLVAFEHGVEQRGLAGGRLLLHLAEPGAGGEADLAAIDADIAGDGAQQGDLPAPLRPTRPIAAAGIDRAARRGRAAPGRRCGW